MIISTTSPSSSLASAVVSAFAPTTAPRLSGTTTRSGGGGGTGRFLHRYQHQQQELRQLLFPLMGNVKGAGGEDGNDDEYDDEDYIDFADDDSGDSSSFSSSSYLPPGRSPEIKYIFLISDATGVTARSTLLKSLAQFDTCVNDDGDKMNDKNASANASTITTTASAAATGTCEVRTRTFTFIRSPAALTQILRTASTKHACVMYTLADPLLRQLAVDECQHLNIICYVDLMGPTLDVLAKYLDEEPIGSPQRRANTKRRNSLGDSYYERINAVEFALKADDGQSPWLLCEADIVVVGVSRSGKTPLSVVMSQTMSLKVANIPLVLEVPPPKQLFDDVDPRRVFCLTIAPSELRKIRSNRLEKRGVRDMERKLEEQQRRQQSSSSSSWSMSPEIPKSMYADRSYLMRDLANARSLCEQHGWTEIDVTGRAVEETATYIVELFNQRFCSDRQQQTQDDDDVSGNDDLMRSPSPKIVISPPPSQLG
jgi:regulator of PEP synthase PpsR (kinase-PPPase family)